jgi:hypothetical protein
MNGTKPTKRRAEGDDTMGLDTDTLTMIVDAIESFAEGRLPAEKLLELDAREEFPEDDVRAICSEELGVHRPTRRRRGRALPS